MNRLLFALLSLLVTNKYDNNVKYPFAIFKARVLPDNMICMDGDYCMS